MLIEVISVVNMAELKKRSTAVFGIDRVVQWVKEHEAPTKEECEVQLEKLELHYNKFVSTHDEIVSAVPVDGADEQEAHDALLIKVENARDTTVARLRRLIGQLNRDVSVPATIHSVTTSAPDMRLEPIRIQPFDGAEENWLQFRDLFEAMVHRRDDMDPACKLTRLLQYVDASKVPMMDGAFSGGYEETWEELKRRYNQVRRLVETHILKILSLPNHPSESGTVIRGLIDNMRATLRAMKVLNYPTAQWNPMLYVIMVQKLPRESLAHFKLTNKEDVVPDIYKMLLDLEMYAETLNGQKDDVVGRTKYPTQRAFAGVTGTVACIWCGEGHDSLSCPAFKSRSAAERLTVAQQLHVCFACLKQGHISRECRNSVRCSTCGRWHHMLLCDQGGRGGGGVPAMLAPLRAQRQ